MPARNAPPLGGLDLEAMNPDMGVDSSARMPSQYVDPCKRAAMQSMKCLERNGHDKTQCHNEFMI